MSDNSTESTDGIDPTALPSGPGCAECTALDGCWVHLRRCAACGHVGCCDSSPAQHASAHYAETGHPIMQSYEPGDDWLWDYAGGVYATLPDGVQLAEPTSHPEDQPAPGPRGKVPLDWRSHIH